MNLLGLALLLLMFMMGGVAFLVVRSWDRIPQSQFSLLSVFLWTAYVAMLAAVFTGEPDPDVWVFLFTPLVFTSLAVAILGIIYRRGEQRAYWVGFAVFGLTYLAMLRMTPLVPSRWFSHEGAVVLAFYVPVPFIGSRISRYFYRSQHTDS